MDLTGIDIKSLVIGLLLSASIVPREETTVDVPIERIELSYNKTSLDIGEVLDIYATVYPLDATFKDVEWICSDTNMEVLAISKLSESVCRIKALQTGSVTVTCKALYPDKNGVYASASVNINVLGAIVFETLALKATNIGHGNYHVGSTALVFEYTPIVADGKNIRVTLDNPLSGGESPYTVRDTMFDNIKVIENSFNSLSLNDYISKSNGYLGWNAEATDGSGLQILNKNIDELTNLKVSLYGTNKIDTATDSFSLKVGYSTYLFRSIYLYQCLTPTSSIVIKNEGDDCVLIDNQYVVTAKSAGTAKISVNIGDVKKYTITITCEGEDYSFDTKNVNFIFTDEFGQSQASNSYGWDAKAENRYRIVCSSNKGAKISKVQLADSSQGTIDGEFITPLKAGTITVNVTYTYPSGTAEAQATREVKLYVWPTVITCGTVNSEYLKKGIAVWCQTNNAIRYFNGLNGVKVDIVFNANEARLLDQIVFNGKVTNTITYNNDGESKRGTHTYLGTTRIYQFEKLVSSAVTIRFQVSGFPDIYDAVTI